MMKPHDGFMELRVRQRIGSAKWRKRGFEFECPYLIVREAPGKKEKSRHLLTHKADLVVHSNIGGPKKRICFGLSLDMASPQTETLFLNAEDVRRGRSGAAFFTPPSCLCEIVT